MGCHQRQTTEQAADVPWDAHLSRGERGPMGFPPANVAAADGQGAKIVSIERKGTKRGRLRLRKAADGKCGWGSAR